MPGDLVQLKDGVLLMCSAPVHKFLGTTWPWCLSLPRRAARSADPDRLVLREGVIDHEPRALGFFSLMNRTWNCFRLRSTGRKAESHPSTRHAEEQAPQRFTWILAIRAVGIVEQLILVLPGPIVDAAVAALGELPVEAQLEIVGHLSRGEGDLAACVLAKQRTVGRRFPSASSKSSEPSARERMRCGSWRFTGCEGWNRFYESKIRR